MTKREILIILFCGLFIVPACAVGPRRARTNPPGPRPLEALPEEVAADQMTVRDFRNVCHVMASDLVTQPFVARAQRPPVITIRKLQNKTATEIDAQIFQETIRGKLMEHSQGAVLFRDDLSYRDILQERARQNADEVNVTITDSVIETKTHDRVHEKQFDQGTLSGSTGAGEDANNVEEQSEMVIDQSATVKSQIAPADYFLRGIIYQMKEPDVNQPEMGMNYFQYQFRLVDARSGLIVWEKTLSSKWAGQYARAAATNAPDPTATAAPPGWPTGQQGQPGTVPPGQGQPGQQQQANPNQAQNFLNGMQKLGENLQKLNDVQNPQKP